MTKAKYAVIGWPVKHSVSPAMQQAAFDAAGLQASYERLAVAPDVLGTAVARLREEGYAGWNVTVPHKQAILQYVDELDPGARRAASANTVLNRDGRLCGYSTDGYGLATAILEHFSVDIEGGRFFFCGCGGAARAATIYFAVQGARTVAIANRTVAKAEEVAAIIQRTAPECETLILGLHEKERIGKVLTRCQALIQATSLGLAEGDPLPLPPDIIPPDIAVMDMIYRETPFLRETASRGCRTADGRGMLLHQGARSFTIWTGLPAPIEAMRRALEEALQQ
ncbi:MAG: shikimate dehydrogenase [Candidatus Pacebacteria bacterium]|nr:shikimate dehydrogenase [Candidatus Paceibacterota bacterium]